ncbi:MAG: 2-oxo acid dehydrogenase subunit E2, partial [Planctomycetota bacterium]
MKTEVKVPSVGESITTGVVVAWLKHNGDQVQEGQDLFELETDKAVLEIPSPGAGVLEILVEEGTEVSIGQTVALLDSEKTEAQPSAPPPVEEPASKAEQKMKAAGPAEKEAAVVESPPPPSPEPTEEAAEPPALAAAAAQAPTDEKRRTERVHMTAIRKKTAERLVQAKRTAAYLTTFNEIDMQKVIEIRAHYKTDFQKEHGIKIGFMSFFVKACCQALREFPDVNARVEGEDIIFNYFYDIGVAISIERGLIVPIIRDADKLHFADIETAIADLAKRAQEKKLSPD